MARDRWIELENAKLQGEDFSGRKLEGFWAAGCRFESCRFDDIRIRDAILGALPKLSEYVDCSFDRAKLRFSTGGNYRLVRCSFRDVDLRDWLCLQTELVDCTFTGRLRGAFFNGTVPEDRRYQIGRERNEFRGNDFSGMDLRDVSFRTGIDLSQQHLPKGPEYLYLPDAQPAVQQARLEVIGWTDLKLRQRAMASIRTFEFELDGGQQQLFLRPEDSAIGREAADAVFAILRRFSGPPP